MILQNILVGSVKDNIIPPGILRAFIYIACGLNPGDDSLYYKDIEKIILLFALHYGNNYFKHFSGLYFPNSNMGDHSLTINITTTEIQIYSNHSGYLKKYKIKLK